MDIAPELIKSIKEEFADIIRLDEDYAKLLEKIQAGRATYSEAHKLAIRVGDNLAKAYKLKLSSDVLPDGKMYYNIAERLVYDTIERPHQLVSEACEAVQAGINEAAGIGMKTAVPDMNTDRLDGLVERLSSGELFDDVDWILDDPIINIMQSEVDDFVKENARVQTDAGLKPKIVRIVVGRACKWCKNLAGTYNYDEVSDTGNDVFRRHENCRCITDYVIDGKRTNVWTKIEYKSEKRSERDVTKEYSRKMLPDGKVIKDPGYSSVNHEDEERFAKWISTNIGGDVKLVKEKNGKFNPDYEWRGKYWELKSTTTSKSTNSAVRKAIKQISENPGGIFLQFSNSVDIENVMGEIAKRTKGKTGFDIVIIEGQKVKKAIRY